MNIKLSHCAILSAGLFFAACTETQTEQNNDTNSPETSEQNGIVDRFADIEVLRYEINDFDKLSLDQKKLVYYMSQAGLAGRDIIYDQNNPFNIEIRSAIEEIVGSFEGDKESDDWSDFMTYAKQIWFANGIHHHYGMDKIMPSFSKEYFNELVNSTNATISEKAIDVIFSNELEMKRKVKDANVDMIVASANGFYGEGVTLEMVEDFYASRIDKTEKHGIEHGLNSTMMVKDGVLSEEIWKSGGKYGAAIDQIIGWLEKAVPVSENDAQKAALEKLIEYYQTGDLKTWDDYAVLWVKSTEGDIDWINGFIETYGDAIGKRASYESIVQITDFEASEQMQVVTQNVQWFEDNAPLMEEHKKPDVKGVTYKVVQVASESGDASPSTPIGVNLPNNEWIREEIGSKSVSLGNIIAAYNNASGEGMLAEFAHDQEEIDRAKKHSKLAGKLHTALHEVVGHASGKINDGVGQPAETLKNNASTLEEARADLVGLYYILDTKLIDLGLIPSLEVGKAEYDGYIRNGMLTQLQRLEVGKDVEEEHMQNRQLVASWVIEKGAAENVIEKIVRDDKIYYNITDYDKLRSLFGELLMEIQRIKSEGDYEAGKNLVDNYGVKVNQEVHKQVLARVAPLNIAPYRGFVNPTFKLVMDDNNEVIDVTIENKQSFVEQMMFYAKEYSTLK